MITRLIDDKSTALILLMHLEKADLLFNILLCKQVLVLLLSLVEPPTNLLLAYRACQVIHFFGIFIYEHRWVRFSFETVIEDFCPAICHYVDLLVIEQDPLTTLSNVDIIVVVTEHYHGT